MGERPYSYIESLPSKFDDKDLKDQIRFQISKNNVKQPKHKSKKKVFNPMAILLMDPVLGASAWARKAKYNKKIADGRLDEVTDAERLEFESKADPNRGFFERLNPEKLIPRDTKKEIDTIGDIATGAVTGIPLGVKSLAEFLTIGADYKFDTNFTEALDKKTREFLKYTGEPETLAGEITQLGTQFLVPMKIIDKIIGRIGKLKYLKGKTLFMQNAKLANKHRFIQSAANLAQRLGTSGLSLGATDFLISGGERKLDPIFFQRTKEEGKTGKELAAARLSNKIKYGKEGAIIGLGFPLIGPALGLGVRTLGYGVGVTYDLAGRVINPLLSAVTKTMAADPIVLPAIAKAFRGNADVIFNQFGTRLALTGLGRTKQWTQQLPPYKEWQRFTVDNIDPVKSGLKRIDNAISWIRSAGKNMAEAAFIKGSASREIRASGKKIQDLLKSIQLKSYDLAKQSENLYNTNKTSPSFMNKIADDIEEVLDGKRKLSNLPEVMQNTVKLLRAEIKKINKIFNKYIPDDESFAHALNGGTKSYIKKSFAFLNNPGRAIPSTNPIFIKAAKFAENLIRRDKNLTEEAILAAGKGVSKSKSIRDYSNLMIRQILNLGKVDNRNPFEILRKVGERFNLEGFLKEGEDLPAVLNKLLGKGEVKGIEGLKNNVLFTTTGMMAAVANKQMYDSLARVMLQQGRVFRTAAEARSKTQSMEIVQIGRIDGMAGLRTELSKLYTDAETAKVLTTNRGPLDILAEIPGYASFLQFKAGVQWGKTVGSPATGSRNFVTAADFAMLRGLIGGRASVTNAVKMQVDDIYNSGKLAGSAEEKLLANIDEGIKYGALDENIVVTELRELLAATQKGKTINSFDSMIKAAGDARIVELMGKLYAGGDHVWKWYGYNWYKSFLKDYAKNDMKRMQTWFKNIANRELDLLNTDGSKKTLAEAIKEASAYYVRNTMPTYSKVPAAIKGVRNLPLGNFVAFPAETLRGSFNVLNISTKEILSGDPILREMGYRGLIGMFTTQGAKGLAIMKTYGALTGLTQDIMKEYQQNLAPGYQRNSQLLAITKAVKGKFKMVDLSTVLPYDYVRRPWEALNNAIQQKRLNNQNATNFAIGLAFDEAGPVREFFDPFISTPIGLEAFLDIKRGYTKTGKKIWSELDSDEDKWNKSWEYFYKQLEPGALTTLRQLYSAYTGVPYKGRVYDEQDVLMGLATGIKPYEVNVNKTIDFLINDYTKIRTKAFDASDMYDTNAHNENDDIEKEFINIQRNIWREQRRIYRAFQTAKKFGVTNSTLRKELRARNVSWANIQKILSGKMDPLPYSKKRFEGKLEEIKENEKDKGFNKKRYINKRSWYPKRELDKILRRLSNQRLDGEFFYDKITPPTIQMKEQTSMMVPEKTTALAQNIKTPPLPGTPMPVVNQTQMAQKNPITNLTRTETALLSPSEQVIARRT
jgi:hypothetical protein|tara:strand:- start:608 stop:4930 length:4323 start_codon:yes stop_codon:yes gene_type:complete